ncbi:hypothetical protein MTO96_013205 [Rhipicephalus appendiculatus]
MDFKGDFTLSRCGEPSERTAAQGPARQMGPRRCNPFRASPQPSPRLRESAFLARPGASFISRNDVVALPALSAVATADSSPRCCRSPRTHLKFIPRVLKSSPISTRPDTYGGGSALRARTYDEMVRFARQDYFF